MPLIGVINSVYLNLYKALKKQKYYFYTAVLVFFINLLINGIATLLIHTMEAVAIATTITNVLWFIFSSFYKKYLRINLKEIFLICCYFIVYFMSHLIFNPLLAMLVYYVSFGSIIYFFDKTFYRQVYRIFVSIFAKKPNVEETT